LHVSDERATCALHSWFAEDREARGGRAVVILATCGTVTSCTPSRLSQPIVILDALTPSRASL
jgi:hypothetical protein